MKMLDKQTNKKQRDAKQTNKQKANRSVITKQSWNTVQVEIEICLADKKVQRMNWNNKQFEYFFVKKFKSVNYCNI